MTYANVYQQKFAYPQIMLGHINCNLYAYGANNPVHYIDPTGMMATNHDSTAQNSTTSPNNLPDANLSSINFQTPTDPNDYHCDIYAWNQAIENGRDPRGQNGEELDLNQINVSSMYDYFPDNRNEGSPPENSEGYAFYDGTDNGIDDPTHVEYYNYGTGDTYTRYNTDGIDIPVPEQRNINNPRNRNWTYVPLQPIQ